MSKLRIAQIAPLWARLPPKTYGGIEYAVTLLTEELVRRGHDVTLYASGDSITSCRLRSVCARNVLDLMSEGAAANYQSYVGAMMAEALRDAGEFDLIHNHLACEWIPFGTATRTPMLFTCHTALSADDEWIMRRYPQVPIQGISHSQVRAVQAERAEPIPVIYNSCDFDAYECRRAPGEYLAFLGRMSFNKNPLGAIRLAREVGMPIVLAGNPQDGPEELYFAEHIKPLIDGNRVRHIGAVDARQKSDFLSRAAALIFPIQWAEPFGIVMVEAMACGVPVVAHRLGSVSEVVEEGITGYTADSIDGLAELVPKALALDRAAIREQARRRFHFTRMADEFEALYRQLL